MIGYGLSLGKSTIINLLFAAKEFLKGRYDGLVKAVREGSLMYNDETGWLVHGQPAWLWVMANPDTTIYTAAESRGKGIFESIYGNSQAKSMHDGYVTYESVTGSDRSLYCWSHFLRFTYEETVNDPKGSEPIKLRDSLVAIYHLGRYLSFKATTIQEKMETEKILSAKLDELIKVKPTTTSMVNILKRLTVQKKGLVQALLLTYDGTNNLSERELRPLAIHRQITNGSDTFRGMETTAILASVVRTQTKRVDENFWTGLKTTFLKGIQEKYPQYLHQAFIDDT